RPSAPRRAMVQPRCVISTGSPPARGVGPLDADADGESVAGQPFDLVPGALDDVLLARVAHRGAHVLASLHRRRAVTPELRVLGHQLRERVAVAAAQRVAEIGEELIDFVHRFVARHTLKPVPTAGTWREPSVGQTSASPHSSGVY